MVQSELGPFALRTFDQTPDGWDELLVADSAVDFFHTRQWSAAACAHYPNLEPVWLVAETKGRLVGGMSAVRRLRPVAGFAKVQQLESNLEGTSGGPLIREDLPPGQQETIFQALVRGYQGLGRGLLSSCSISLNTLHENRFGHLLPQDSGWKRREVPGAVIDLAGGQQQVEMNLIKKNKRNERNRGMRQGAEAFTTNDAKWIDLYYPIYEEASRLWGIDPVPRGFLLDLLQLGSDRVFFTCVKLGDQVIGGHLNLVSGDRVTAWNGVTDPAFARTHFPATIAVWWDIVESCARGARWLDLGASGGVVTLSGFKKHFGAELESRGYYVQESSGLKLLQKTRVSLDGLSSLFGRRSPSERLHDGPTTTDRP